ncbi:hypothetical protein [Acinetobacter pittii]|uniref:hypothetical protein n=1 Tax=Acinetobacter pittii TaxID=48296 RepID=UPI00388EC573
MKNIMIVDVGCTFWTLEKIFQNANQNKRVVVLPAKDIKPLSTVRKFGQSGYLAVQNISDIKS